MKSETLFEIALNIHEPWKIAQVQFPLEKQQLELNLDFPRGSRFACPECKEFCKVYDTEERTWRHLNFFQYETYLTARLPRIECPQHGVKTIQVPWARPGSGFTLLFEAMVMMLAQNGMMVNAIGRVVNEHDTRVWRILQHYVEEARQEQDYSAVKTVGMDETSRGKGHSSYVTVFVDLEKRKVIYATDGKGAETVKEFKEDLLVHQGEVEQIEEFCADMSPAFQSGIEKNFPDAKITFDNFHLMKIINKAVDEVRKQEQKLYPDLLTGTKYLWLKNDWNLSEKQKKERKKIFETLRHQKTHLLKAIELRSIFQDIFAIEDIQEGEAFLKKWYYWATHSRVQPMIEAAKSIKNHWEGVIRWFHTRITNGLLEGMNSLIQSAKTRARGFRSVKYFITIIYLVGGKLKFNLPSLIPATHTK